MLRDTPTPANGCGQRRNEGRTPAISGRVAQLSIERGDSTLRLLKGSRPGQRPRGRMQGSSFAELAPFRMEPVVTGSSVFRDVAAASFASVPPSRAGPASHVDAQTDRKPTAATVFNVQIRTERRRPSSTVASICASYRSKASLTHHGKGCVDPSVMRWGRPPSA